MFRFADLGRVWWPVEVPFGFGEDGTEAGTIHLLFRLFTDEELDARERTSLETSVGKLLAHLGGPVPIESADQVRQAVEESDRIKEGDREAVLERTLDWRLGEAEGGEPFSRDKLEALLVHRPMFVRIRAALFEASREGVRKN